MGEGSLVRPMPRNYLPVCSFPQVVENILWALRRAFLEWVKSYRLTEKFARLVPPTTRGRPAMVVS
jgi:hypothetical protein